jgi:hypothetical protein
MFSSVGPRVASVAGSLLGTRNPAPNLKLRESANSASRQIYALSEVSLGAAELRAVARHVFLGFGPE